MSLAFAPSLVLLPRHPNGLCPITPLTPLRPPVLSSSAHPARMTCAPLHPRPDGPTHAIPSPNISQLAHLELRAGDPDAAHALLESHLVSTPTDAKAWLALGKATRLSKGIKPAVSVMRRATTTLPTDPYLWHFFANLTRRAYGDHAARTVFQQAISQVSRSAVLSCAWAELEASMGRNDLAAELFARAIVADPSDALTYVKWANAERSRGKLEAARRVLDRGVEDVPRGKVVIVYTAYAGMEADLKRWHRARQLYTLAAEAAPTDRLVWQAWAVMEQRTGDLIRARELFERAVIADPAFASCWQAWGLLEERAGNVDAARALLDRGTRADPNDPLCWQAWAALEGRAGNFVEARRLFTEAAERVPADRRAAPLYLEWARMESDAGVGDLEAAREKFAEGVERRNERSQDIVRLLHSWAGLERRAGEMDKARQLFHRAIKMNRRDHRTLHALATLEEEVGEFEEAKQLLTRCLRIAPYDATAKRSLAALEWRHFAEDGGIERARSMLRNMAKKPRGEAAVLRFWASLEDESGDRQMADRLRVAAMRR